MTSSWENNLEICNVIMDKKLEICDVIKGKNKLEICDIIRGKNKQEICDVITVITFFLCLCC